MPKIRASLPGFHRDRQRDGFSRAWGGFYGSTPVDVTRFEPCGSPHLTHGKPGTTLPAMQVIREIEEFRPFHGGVLVPTMGALHAGHTALVQQAVRLGRPVVVSIFVNPTQFGPNEDYHRYPRTFDADCAACETAGADAIFAPDAETVYPPASDAAEVPPLPEVAMRPGLEDAIRPTHFAGVCQVVARLFDLTRPCGAVFGEKDFQQLLVIRAMVEQDGERWPNLQIVSGETVREPDGLAMSSRNGFLALHERSQAIALYHALTAAQGTDTPTSAEHVMSNTLTQHGLDIEYAVVRDARSLRPIKDYRMPARALLAARLGTVRLIDNMALTQGE